MGSSEKKNLSWNDIKLLFRGIDIAIMREKSDRIAGPKRITLDNYHEVVKRKSTIESVVKKSKDFEVMPKPPFSRWSQRKIEDFQSWSNTSDPLIVDEVRKREAEKFMALSEFLTGFNDPNDNLQDDPELAYKHLMRLREKATLNPERKREPPFSIEDLEYLIDQFNQYAPEHIDKFETTVLSQNRYTKVAKAIILLWYTSAFFDEQGYASDSGTDEDNQYIQGLIWRVIQAHPMGYSPEGAVREPDKLDDADADVFFHYWKWAPQANGRYSGLGIKQRYEPES